MGYEWLAAAAVIFLIEMFMGTVYLLVLSASFLGAALAAWWFGHEVAIWVASSLSLLGCIGVWRYKLRHAISMQPDDDLDIGQTVLLQNQMATGDWCVQYRGTMWTARSAFAGSLKSGTTATIIGRDGNILIIQ